ncbi:MAG: glycosyltransferase family 4 protein [Filimonas sp.]|nr:glycosyltransferase family 4 protein [Filimonas sp.]
MYLQQPINVCLIARATLYSTPGGDTIQIRQTALHLQLKGITADVKLTNEHIDYQSYDLLHFFNITRPADILYHIRHAKIPFVVSPIFVDYTTFDKTQRQGISGFICRLLTGNQNEYLKTVLRWIKGKDKLVSIEYLWQGQTRAIRQIMQKASMLLPNSASEYERLYHVSRQQVIHEVIPNGINENDFTPDVTIERDPLLVICAARIEGIKNQLTLIKALNNTRYKLVLIGATAPNQSSYYATCRKVAASNVQFIDHLPQEALREYYNRAAIHILPSWFETTGLSSLEAAVMGCKIIVTAKGDTMDYFEDLATYCDPASPASILAAVDKTAAMPYSSAMRNKILSSYTWQQATEATLHAYEQVIPCYESTHRHTRHPWHTQSLRRI